MPIETKYIKPPCGENVVKNGAFDCTCRLYSLKGLGPGIYFGIAREREHRILM